MEIQVFKKSFWNGLTHQKQLQFIDDIVIVELSDKTFVVYAESKAIIKEFARWGTFPDLEFAKLFAGAIISQRKKEIPGAKEKLTISDLIVASNVFQKRLNDFITANTHLIG